MSYLPKQLGPYRIENEIGRGGMGTVYLAAHVDDPTQQVAVKVLAPAYVNESGFRVRFEAEIESLKKLSHPNIVRLFGYGEEGEFLYYCMEYVNGMSLAEELLQGRRFDWRETVEFGIQICRALKHAHDHGVIHRDIKPANLLLNDQQEVKLSDFGIARLFGVQMTSDGGVIGTAEYMAPEQADGRNVTPTCDLYSLGGVLYTLLAGRPPFLAKSYPEMLRKQKEETPEPLAEHSSDLPKALIEIVENLLAKDPSDRLPNAAIVASQLDKVITLRNVTHSPWQETTGFTPPSEKSGRQLATQMSTSSATVIGKTKNDKETTEKKNPVAAEISNSGTKFTEYDSHASNGVAHPKYGSFFSIQTGVLLLALIGLIGFIYYQMQGPTLDERYDEIKAILPTATTQDLLDTSGEIDKILQEMPEADLRQAELKEYQNEIKLIRLDRRIRAAISLSSQKENLSPLQRIYGETILSMATSPTQAIAQLQTLVKMYDSSPELEKKTRQCVELIKYQLNHQRGIVRQMKQDHLTLIRQSLKQADEISKTDPQGAKKICQAMIDHYQGSDWTEKEIKECRALLDRLQQNMIEDSKGKKVTKKP